MVLVNTVFYEAWEIEVVQKACVAFMHSIYILIWSQDIITL